MISPLLKTLFRTLHSCGLYYFIGEYPPHQVSNVSFRPLNLDLPVNSLHDSRQSIREPCSRLRTMIVGEFVPQILCRPSPTPSFYTTEVFLMVPPIPRSQDLTPNWKVSSSELLLVPTFFTCVEANCAGSHHHQLIVDFVSEEAAWFSDKPLLTFVLCLGQLMI